MNGIPEAVLKQKRDIEARYANAQAEAEQIANTPQPGNQPPVAAPQPDQPTVPQLDPADRSQTLDYMINGTEAPAPVAPTPQAAPAIPQEPETVTIRKEDYEALMHHNRVIQGKLDAEGPRNALQIRELKASVASLQDELRTPKEPAWLTQLTPEDRQLLQDRPDALGSDYRAAKGETRAAFETVTARQNVIEERLDVAEKKHKLSESNAASDKFLVEVERITPGARQIDTMPEFESWLKLPDPASGNGSLLEHKYNSAFHRGDEGQVAAMYRQFQELRGLVQEAPAADVTGQLKPEVATGAVSTVPQSASPDPTITGSQITQFKHDISRRIYTSEQATEILAKIEAAESKGLVDYSR